MEPSKKPNNPPRQPPARKSTRTVMVYTNSLTVHPHSSKFQIARDFTEAHSYIESKWYRWSSILGSDLLKSGRTSRRLGTAKPGTKLDR